MYPHCLIYNLQMAIIQMFGGGESLNVADFQKFVLVAAIRATADQA